MKNNSEIYAINERFLNSLPQGHALGLELVAANSNEIVIKLPYSTQIIGDLRSGIIHGGAITTLLDTTAGGCVFLALQRFELCPTLDIRVDYMRPAEPGKDVYAKAFCYRVSSNVLFMRAEAYQGETSIAHCVANFVRLPENLMTNQKKASSNIAKTKALPDEVFEINKQEISDKEIKALLSEKKYRTLINTIPYARFIGIELIENAEEKVDGAIFKMPPLKRNIGNPVLPAIHGGVISGFMEMSGILYLFTEGITQELPKIIDFSVDYLRAGLFRDTYSKVTITRQGARVVNVHIVAWQDSYEKPIATSRAHFLLRD